MSYKRSDNASYGLLSFPPPTLVNPTHIYLNAGNSFKAIMSPTVDYIVHMPTVPVTTANGIEITGGRNVVLKGGEVNFPQDYNLNGGLGNRYLWIKGNSSNEPTTRIVHIEGLLFRGFGREGINIDCLNETGMIVQLQNISLPSAVQGSLATNHADILQCWRGPFELRIDRFFGRTTYQGFMFQPVQFQSTTLGTWTLRNVYLEGTEASGALAYMVTGSGPQDRPRIVTDRMYLKHASAKAYPSQVIYENLTFWGTGIFPAPGGALPALSGFPGVNYVSPGYITEPGRVMERV